MQLIWSPRKHWLKAGLMQENLMRTLLSPHFPSAAVQTRKEWPMDPFVCCRELPSCPVVRLHQWFDHYDDTLPIAVGGTTVVGEEL